MNNLGKFGFILENLRKQTPEQIKKNLIKAVIVDKNGDLAEKYRSQKK